MKVIYKKNIFEKMDMEIAAAKGIQKTIDKFILDQNEWKEFINIYRPIGVSYQEYNEHIRDNKIPLFYKTIRVEFEV